MNASKKRETPVVLGAILDWLAVLGGMAGAQGLVALSVILVARNEEPSLYGQYLSCFALSALLVVLPGAGLDNWLLFRGSAIDRLMALWRSALELRLRLLAIWGLGLAVIVSVLAGDDFPPVLLGLTAAGLAADSVSLLSYSALRNLNEHRLISFLQIAGGVALLATAVSLPTAGGGIIFFAVGRTVISATIAAATLLFLRGRRTERDAEVGLREMAREARPFLISDIAVQVYMRADLTIVSLFLGAVGAGIYGPALNLVNFTFLVPTALYMLILPRLSSSFSTNLVAFKRLAQLHLLAQVLGGCALALTIYLLAPTAIALAFGSAYAPSASVLRLLSPLLIAKSINFGLGAVLTASAKQSWRTTTQVAVATFNAVANAAVVISLGLPGVAAVYVASELLLAAGYMLAVSRLWPVLQRRTAL